jgi:hypothetical protein
MKGKILKAAIWLALALTVATTVNAADGWIKVAGGEWDPTPKMLNDLKAQIESYVSSRAKAQGQELKNWEDYTFQYQGQEEKGRKFIFINAFCSQRDRQGLDKKMVVIFDGGSCYFNVKYDPSLKEFFDLFINGEA